MKRMVLSFFFLMVFVLQVESAEVPLQKVPSPSVESSAIKTKPKTGLKPVVVPPDLVVQEFKLWPAIVPNGGLCNYKLVIKNNGGTSNVSPIGVAFNITPQTGKNIYVAVPAANQSLTFTGQLGVPVDSCMGLSYNVKLDFQNKIAESNENNNTAIYSIAIEKHPDVGFCRDPSVCRQLSFHGGVNNQVYIGGEIYNYGCAISPACSIDLNFPEQWPLRVEIPPISPGKFYAFHTYMKWAKPGVKMGEVIIRNAVNDARDFNNRVKVKVTIVK